MELDLSAHLLAQPAVSSKIGARLYPVRLPQGVTLPAVSYQRIAGTSGIDHEGPDGLGRGRIQFDCWADRYEVVVPLAETIRAELAAIDARIINVVDLPASAIAKYRRMVEVSLWHQE